jgi:hypothetical protein
MEKQQMMEFLLKELRANMKAMQEKGKENAKATQKVLLAKMEADQESGKLGEKRWPPCEKRWWPKSNPKEMKRQWPAKQWRLAQKKSHPHWTGNLRWLSPAKGRAAMLKWQGRRKRKLTGRCPVMQQWHDAGDIFRTNMTQEKCLRMTHRAEVAWRRGDSRQGHNRDNVTPRSQKRRVLWKWRQAHPGGDGGIRS